ncbi:hypothetical protein BDA99DRAFT_535782 [Phascolomyces articulosus]|uniref:Uncharacterized protein n=1 Tax=Phascolomyces articulosus TaxID=60185 RepID=A0AAD5K3Z5_9FUNG|nr:hypothetical protein BDA99DRAFT_535782 [Phascolomyces articulosus]
MTRQLTDGERLTLERNETRNNNRHQYFRVEIYLRHVTYDLYQRRTSSLNLREELKELFNHHDLNRIANEKPHYRAALTAMRYTPFSLYALDTIFIYILLPNNSGDWRMNSNICHQKLRH